MMLEYSYMSEKTDPAADIADSDLFRQAVGAVEPLHDDRIVPTNGAALPLPRSTEADEQQVLHDMISVPQETNLWNSSQLDYALRMHAFSSKMETT